MSNNLNTVLEHNNSSKDIYFTDCHSDHNNDTDEVINDLLKPHKSINPKFFYDTNGSELFEKITQLEEYYPTRTERKILKDNAEEIATYCGSDAVLIEPGSGSSEKVRLLLDAIKPRTYIPMDIAGEFLQLSAKRLHVDFPWLHIHAVCADFSQLASPPDAVDEGQRIIFYPGSTIGNMPPEDALRFLKKLKGWVGAHSGGAVIGVDLHKDKNILNAAYNDEQGITAEFNLNALEHINRRCNANFDIENFKHHAYYNEKENRIEMHLTCLQQHDVTIENVTIPFLEGESIHTENSYKYTIESFTELAQQAGFEIKRSWLDEKNLFSVHFLS